MNKEYRYSKVIIAVYKFNSLGEINTGIDTVNIIINSSLDINPPIHLEGIDFHLDSNQLGYFDLVNATLDIDYEDFRITLLGDVVLYKEEDLRNFEFCSCYKQLAYRQNSLNRLASTIKQNDSRYYIEFALFRPVFWVLRMNGYHLE